jgi:hypothetical protein
MSSRTPGTLVSQVVATSMACLLALTPSCGDRTESNEPAEFEADAEFRLGPNPAALAAEVNFFRLLPVVLAPTSPVGTLAASAGVEPDGSAKYDIPIEVTPGPRGMQPRISVGYSSNGEGGALGQRFDLGGLSAIARCTGSIADDGRYRPIRFDDNDPLCLDRTRLVLAGGVHGEAGAEYRTASDPFARITLDDDMSEWGSSITVERQDGTIDTYGTAPASLWIGSTNGTRTPWSWNILRSCDRWSNCVEYEYEHGPDLGNGPSDLRIAAARYGGTGAPATRRSVTFSWIDRTDVVTKYVFGATLRRAKLLDRITVNGPSAAEVRSYRFGYQVHPQSGQSRLDWAELCDAASVCLPATAFEWSNDAATSLTHDEWGTEDLAEEQQAFIDAEHTVVGEFSGFGGEEVIFRDNQGDSRWNMWLGPHKDPGFLPGGGDEDYLVPIPELPYEDVLPPRTALSWTYVPDVDIADVYLERLGGITPEFPMTAVDFNGDALDDLLIPVRPYPVGEAWNGDPTPHAQRLWVAANVDGENFVTEYFDDDSEERIYQVIPIDHDGDVLTDVWMCRGPSPTDGTWVLAHNDGAGDGQYGFEFDDTEIGCSVHSSVAYRGGSRVTDHAASSWSRAREISC